MASLRLCTSNLGKAAEFSDMLGMTVSPIKLRLDELQALDPEVVAVHKAQQAFEQCAEPVLIDDTGLHLDGLGGFPGALVAWVLGAGGPRLLHRMLPVGAPPSCVAVSVIALADGNGVRLFVGRVRGSVLSQPRGAGGFGFDPVFVPDGHNRTLAEMTPAEKNALSPRRIAVDALRAELGLGGEAT